jgi:hypothetical protein
VKWMLVVLVMGQEPVKTEMTFDSLQECVEAEFRVRVEVAAAYNNWVEWAAANPEVSGYPGSEGLNKVHIGMSNIATCIPHA